MRLFALAGVLLVAVACPGAAATIPRLDATLIAPTAAATVGRPLRLGLRLALAPGWHTYWSNPGDAGLAPSFTVGVDGAKPAPVVIDYPAPEVMSEGPLAAYGYTGTVLLPFTVPLPANASAGDTARIALHAEVLVCADICVPESVDRTVSLPLVAAGVVPPPSAASALFARAAADAPRAVPLDARYAPDGALRVSGPGLDAGTVARAVFVPAAPGLIRQAAPQPFAADADAITLRLAPDSGFAHATGLAGVLLLTDRTGARAAFAVSARPVRSLAAAAPAPAAVKAPGPGLAALALLGLVGGLLLNLMPCVFPVLALKAFALGRHGGARGAARRSALLYAVGATGSFALLGAALLACRAFGSTVGWGFQFQSPAFVGVAATVLFAVGLNLLGVFSVGAGRFANAGSALAARGGAAGDLLTGVLAVVVATPCTAPFMGAAIAGALAGPPAGALVVFAALGVGLALPMLALAALPGLARALPRPGAWTERLRGLLAFPMFASALWLVWVASLEAGGSGVLLTGAAMIGVGFAAWVGRSDGAEAPSGAGRVVRRGSACAALAASAVVLACLAGAAVPASSGAGVGAGAPANAEPYSAARLARLRADGRPVLVDMSAAWCLTCLVNERVALAPPAVADAFRQHRAVLLRGDWTRRDPSVTAFLHRFDREGVPFAVWFPAGGGAPETLPQVLTEAEVLARLDGGNGPS